MILWGIPWILMKYLKNIYATSGVVKVVRTDEKWATLVSISTVTKIASWWWEDIGRPKINSIEITSHFHSSISCHCKIPPRWLCSIFTLYHSRHLATILEICNLMPSEWYNCLKSECNFLTLGCAAYGADWASNKMNSHRSPIEGT